MRIKTTFLFFLLLLGIPLLGQDVIRGPYLQKATPNSIIIKWRTNLPTESRVYYGTRIGDFNNSVSDITLKTDHELELTNLAPATTYHYLLANTRVVLLAADEDLYFKTPPPVGTKSDIKVWVLGDCGTADNNQRAVRDAYYNYIGTQHTDAILLLGDNAYESGTDAEYQRALFENMYEDKLKNSIMWSCLGNHDGYTADSRTQKGPYYDIFSFPTAGESGGVASGTEAYYSFDYGNIHFICLDSYETNRAVGSPMYNWCENDIQNTTQDWIVAFWHHPPYSKGSHDSDTEGNLYEMRNNFVPMLEDNGVDLVLSGHSHSYERSYFINGHYDYSYTFNPVQHSVGKNGVGDGRLDGDGAYDKGSGINSVNDGAVYITTGTAGKISGGSLNHPAMFYSVNELGSCVLEVKGDQMNVKFIRENGTIDDYFTINKSADRCIVGGSCDDGDPCTSDDKIDGNCDCVGVYSCEQITTSEDMLQLRVLLEGLYNPITQKMTSFLRTENLLPLQHPFGGAPWYYNGTETVSAIPNNAIDWILIAIRDHQDKIVTQKAGFIAEDGEVLGIDGRPGLPVGDFFGYHISIHHRNHLSIVSAEPVFNKFYDFTTSAAMVKGNEQLKNINGKYFLFAGDFNANGIINNQDYNEWRNHYYSLNQYLSFDGDANGIVNNQDYNLWAINRSKMGYIHE